MQRQISTHFILILVIALLACCSSCDVFQFNSYYIQNSTDTSISVSVFRKIHSVVPDSVFIVGKDETTEIHKVGNRLQKHYKKNAHDIVIEFDSIVVKKRGARSTKDFLNNDSWTFTPNEGTYKVQVSNTDFK